MQKTILAAISLLSFYTTNAKDNTVPRPKLVVGIVVDQMRWDYLYKYYDEYGNDGFKRLINKGFNCQQTFISYLPSFTAPGHTCVYTGSVPSIHGIAANDWVDNKTGKYVYCTDDYDVHSVGGSSRAGKMSPKNMLVTTITDELRLSTNMQSRVFGVAIKDRGSILPGGHLANGAYWYDDSTGNFMSSSYYGSTLPQWLNNFNARRMPDSFLKSPWQLMRPTSSYTHNIGDNNPYEGLFLGEKQPVFPHMVTDLAKPNYSLLRRIPAGNTISIEMAKACIDGERLGQQTATDFLCLSFSSTDYIGHMYSPTALEVEDNYLQLDRDIALFLNYLDDKIGKNNYVLFLTADHGAAYNAEYLKDLKVPAGNSSETAEAKALNTMVKNQFGIDSSIIFLDNYQVSLNEQKIPAEKRDEIKKAIIASLRDRPGTAYVIDLENIQNSTVPEPIRSMVINGYNSKRSGCIQFIPEPGWYDGYAKTGTTHGTWNPYDTHIPLLWYGWHISPGETNQKTYMTDISATLAALLHIQMPNGCVGSVIKDVVR
jgi:predicted AlkP superfamily pyrophosphatase or phosphodiesterase